MAEDATKAVPTVGYDSKGRPRTFALAPGAKLPNGWADRPPKGTHPAELADGVQPDSVQPEPAPRQGKAS